MTTMAISRYFLSRPYGFELPSTLPQTKKIGRLILKGRMPLQLSISDNVVKRFLDGTVIQLKITPGLQKIQSRFIGGRTILLEYPEGATAAQLADEIGQIGLRNFLALEISLRELRHDNRTPIGTLGQISVLAERYGITPAHSFDDFKALSDRLTDSAALAQANLFHASVDDSLQRIQDMITSALTHLGEMAADNIARFGLNQNCQTTAESFIGLGEKAAAAVAALKAAGYLDNNGSSILAPPQNPNNFKLAAPLSDAELAEVLRIMRLHRLGQMTLNSFNRIRSLLMQALEFTASFYDHLSNRPTDLEETFDKLPGDLMLSSPRSRSTMILANDYFLKVLLINLAANALRATEDDRQLVSISILPEGSLVTLKVSNSVSLPAMSDALGAAYPDNLLEFAVDGRDSILKQKIFHTGVSTRPADGQERGQGLSFCFDIVTKVFGGELAALYDPALNTFTMTIKFKASPVPA